MEKLRFSKEINNIYQENSMIFSYYKGNLKEIPIKFIDFSNHFHSKIPLFRPENGKSLQISCFLQRFLLKYGKKRF